MAILTCTNIGQSFGNFDLFGGISAQVPNDGKVGLVGPNGIGKTTLLRILAGLSAPTTGAVHFARGARMGYLRQEAMDAFAGQDNTVYQEMLTVFADLRRQEAALREMETAMSAEGVTDELFEAYSQAQTRFEIEGGYTFELRIQQVLTGLGFERDDWELPLNILSGGQKTRALLARLLLEAPDLLILDEPTNHLDIEAVEWLEGALKTWDGAILIVSHDRYFLDRVVNTIWEMSRNGLEVYRGNYSHYLTQREERWEHRQQQFDALQDRFLKELDYIKRNIARDATKNMAVGRLKRLIRQVKMVQAGGVESVTDMKWSEARSEYDISGAKWEVPDVEAAIKSLARPSNRLRPLKMNLHTAHRSGNVILEARDLRIGYPDKLLFGAEDIELRRLECAALIGPNGSGKTTFLRTLLGEIEPLAGQLRLGASLKLGYFAQAHDQLDPEVSVIDTLMTRHNMLPGEARNYLGRFLFSHEDVFKPVRLLSGGERGRLALALLALEGANFLLLDEPTNHLDIPAQEVLQAALENFDGTILLVSHDRYLVDRLASQIWEVRGDRLRVFDGDYQNYLAMRDQESQAARDAAAAQREAEREEKANGQSAGGLSKNEQRRRAQAMQTLETQIHDLEVALEEVATALQTASAVQDFPAIQQASQRYADLQAHLEDLLDAWEVFAREP